MNSALPDSADLVPRLRQQLILAQVRIMELEDVRDELAPRLAGIEKLLADAQTLADTKIDEATHLAAVQADQLAQLRHWQHLQHAAHETLEATRTQLAQRDARLATTEQRSVQLQRELVTLATENSRAQQTASRLEFDLAALTTLAAERLVRIEALNADRLAMKASRSWRWTAWLRSLERTFSRKKP